MSYSSAMERAGAKVLEFQEFGSYQGEWWALVEYNGQRAWVNGSYGSCSGCDAWEGEFGYGDGHSHGDPEAPYDWKNEVGSYDDSKLTPDSCEKCKELHDRIVEFGKSYLDNLLTQEEAEKAAARNLEWDYDAKEMVEFIKGHAAVIGS